MRVKIFIGSLNMSVIKNPFSVFWLLEIIILLSVYKPLRYFQIDSFRLFDEELIIGRSK